MCLLGNECCNISYAAQIARRAHSHMRDNKLQHKRVVPVISGLRRSGRVQNPVFQHRSVDRIIGLVSSRSHSISRVRRHRFRIAAETTLSAVAAVTEHD